MLRTALLFVGSAVRLVYAEPPGPVAVCLPKQAHSERVNVSLGGDHIVEHRRVPRAALKTTAIVLTPHELRISLGAEPIPVPKPFAGMLRFHLHNRPNLRITGDSAATAAALRVVSIW